MNEYTASNGYTILARKNATVDWWSADRRHEGIIQVFTHSDVWQALREFFQHERDEELGRWRWPENPDVVVYLDGHPSSRSVTIFFEKTGGIVIGMAEKFLATTPDEGHESRKAARAYFEAHPERKPWEDAEEGQVWIVTPSKALTLGEEVEYPAIFQAGRFRDHGGSWDARDLTKARRIWPKGKGNA